MFLSSRSDSASISSSTDGRLLLFHSLSLAKEFVFIHIHQRTSKIVGINYGSAQSIVHDDLGYHKVCAQWVLKQLTAQHEQQRVDVATRFLQCYEKDPGILEQIVTGDKTWVHHYELESKRQSTEWKHPLSPVRKKFRQQPSCKKLMITFFWDMQGPVLVKFQAHGETVNSAKYPALLQD
jgi:hypothetical protein